MKKKILSTALAVATASIGATITPMALAQQYALEEIVVTARKREENLQDVGLSVSAMTGTEVDRTFARDIKDLAFVSPNLIIDDTSQGPGGNAAMFIRGVGVADVEKNFEPAVGVTVDGLFIGANSGAIMRSVDLASLEVLRGPQGTLFGRNTIGGTINIKRSKPTGEFGGKVRAGYGDYDTYWLDGIVNFGITDDLAAKLSVAKNDQQDGYFKNVNTGNDDGAVDYQSYGLNLVWNASETLELEYTYQNEETDQDTPPLVNMSLPGTLACDGFGLCAESMSTPSSGDRYKVTTLMLEPATASLSPAPTSLVTSLIADATPRINDDAFFDAETHILEARWEISDSLTFNYIYGTFETEEGVVTNFTSDAIMMFGTDRPAEYEQESHELRFTYDDGGAFKLVAGAYFWESEYDIRLRSWITFQIPGTILDIPQNTHQETESTAFFFEADYALSDALTLTVGGRYTEDEKLSQQRGNLSTEGQDGNEKWDEFTPKVGARFQLNDDAMIYATYSRGYRSGGFNGRVDDLQSATISYNPETVDNYEVGFKSEWADGRIRLNGAVFYMDYEDKQEEIGLVSPGPTGQSISVFNAATATMQGVELELQAIVTEGLSVRANLGLLDTEYDEFIYPDPLNPGVMIDDSNLEFRRAPELTGSLDTTYEWQLGEGQAWVRGSYRFIGDHFIEQSNQPQLENDNQHLVDLSVNYSINGVTVSLFGRNLTEEDGWAHALNVSGLFDYASARPPRTWGAEVTYKFGAN